MSKVEKSSPAKFEVFALAQAERKDFVLYGAARKLEKTARTIRKVLTDAGRLAVISSGQKASCDTAQRLVENSWIADHSVIPMTSDFILGDEVFALPQRAKNIPSQLQTYQNIVEDRAPDKAHLGIVLVVGPEFITHLPEVSDIRYDQQPDSTPLALNHFNA